LFAFSFLVTESLEMFSLDNVLSTFVHSRRHFSFASFQGSVLSDTAEVLLSGSPDLVMWSDVVVDVQEAWCNNY